MSKDLWTDLKNILLEERVSAEHNEQRAQTSSTNSVLYRMGEKHAIERLEDRIAAYIMEYMQDNDPSQQKHESCSCEKGKTIKATNWAYCPYCGGSLPPVEIKTSSAGGPLCPSCE